MGTPGNDTLTGTNANDVIVGLGGNDMINGGNGDDVLCGNDGNDTLDGGNGNDRLEGGEGNDNLNGRNGNDILRGDAGDDTLTGDNGNDVLEGGAGQDTLNGGNGSDTCADGEATNGCETITTTDTTPPTISATVTPAANAEGWHKSPVTVAFTCSDATSGIATCPTALTLNTEGVNQVVTGTTTDQAGNSASTSISLNIDQTPPNLQALLTPTANSTGWHNNSPVTVSFIASDALSGVASTTPQTTVTTEGANQTVSGEATDVAGNQAL